MASALILASEGTPPTEDARVSPAARPAPPWGEGVGKAWWLPLCSCTVWLLMVDVESQSQRLIPPPGKRDLLIFQHRPFVGMR